MLALDPSGSLLDGGKTRGWVLVPWSQERDSPLSLNSVISQNPSPQKYSCSLKGYRRGFTRFIFMKGDFYPPFFKSSDLPVYFSWDINCKTHTYPGINIKQGMLKNWRIMRDTEGCSVQGQSSILLRREDRHMQPPFTNHVKKLWERWINPRDNQEGTVFEKWTAWNVEKDVNTSF